MTASDTEDSILDDSDPCDIEQTELSTPDERIVLDIQTYLNTNAVGQLDTTLVRWIYAILNVKVLESGPPDLDTLDRVMISQFKDRDSVCEMRQSQVYSELLFSGSDSSSSSYQGLRTMAYKKAVSFLAKDITDKNPKKKTKKKV